MAETIGDKPHDQEVTEAEVADDARRWCIQVAAEFVAAQPGGIARILNAHHHRDDGACAGCLHRPAQWPCTTVVIAHHAQHLGRCRAAGPDARIVDQQAGDTP